MSNYWLLIRPRIMAMVLLAMAAAAWLCGGQSLSPGLAHALLGTSLVIAGALALNQRLELPGDAKMPRTAGRPLPAGRLSSRQVVWFGAAASALGIAYLAGLTGLVLALLAAGSWLLYVFAYTPLKTVTAWQTPIGAVAGAMPILLGAAAVRALNNPLAWTLFGVVFFWQFPHAMAIAWLYRQQFATAGVKVAPVVDPSGRLAARLAVLGAAALLPVSLTPAWPQVSSPLYAVCALALGIGYLACALAFLRHTDEARARLLLRASLVYLPLLLAVLLLATLLLR